MRTRVTKRVGVVVVASLLVGTSVLAQGPFAPSQNPIDAVLAKLNQIIEMLTPIAPPTAGPVTLSTALISQRLQEDLTNCILVNVGTVPITQVVIRAKNFVGATYYEISSASIQPGRSEGFGIGGYSPSARCEFSFVGFAKDVRATILSTDSATGHTSVALDAR